MDDLLDMELLKQFGNSVERVEKPEPKQMGKMSPYHGMMEHLASTFSFADDLLQALEVEIFEKSLEEKN